MKRNFSKCPKCLVWQVVLTLLFLKDDWFLRISEMADKWRFLSFCYPASDRARRDILIAAILASNGPLHPIFEAFLYFDHFLVAGFTFLASHDVTRPPSPGNVIKHPRRWSQIGLILEQFDTGSGRKNSAVDPANWIHDLAKVTTASHYFPPFSVSE